MSKEELTELNCRRLLNAATSEMRSDILKDSLGYTGLAQAYIELCNENLRLKVKLKENDNE